MPSGSRCHDAAAGEAVLFDLFDTWSSSSAIGFPRSRSTAAWCARRPGISTTPSGPSRPPSSWPTSRARCSGAGRRRRRFGAGRIARSRPRSASACCSAGSASEAAMAREALPLLLATHMRELSEGGGVPGTITGVPGGARPPVPARGGVELRLHAHRPMVLEREGWPISSRPSRLGRGRLAQAPPGSSSTRSSDGARAAAALFVGDRADIDVAGAHGVGHAGGVDQPGRRALPDGVTAPPMKFAIWRAAGTALHLGPAAGIQRAPRPIGRGRRWRRHGR
jgi:hypothetical protein